MQYLNDWDRTIPNLDVCDDYKTEKQHILQHQGKSFRFSFGDVSYSIRRINVKFILLLLCLVCC